MKALYKEYENKKSHGLSRSEAAAFNDIREICRLSDMCVDDIKELYGELAAIGYLEYESSDMFEIVISNLTGKGIKYGEENFDEPSYIMLLKEIVDKYTSRKGPIHSDSLAGYPISDFSILKSEGLIIETSKYLKGGKFAVKPTDRGIAIIASMN